MYWNTCGQGVDTSLCSVVTSFYKIGAGQQLTQLCLSKNFSIMTENAANPAQPAHAALGPPTATQWAME